MLILQRRAGESVVIGDDITVSVVSIEGGRVRLAITAPGEVPIFRSELIVATAANRDSAMEESAPDELLHMLGGVLEPHPGGHPSAPLKQLPHKPSPEEKEQ